MRVSEILILARVRLAEFDLPTIADYYFEVGQRLANVEGCHGISVWRDPDNSESFLVIYEYADDDAAARGLTAIAEVRVKSESKLVEFNPADVIRVRTHRQTDKRVSESHRSSYLSMSVRIADPGYGPELLEEIGRIFDELHLIPGCLGSVYGPNAALEEEVVGIVTWDSEDAFISSLPPGSKYVRQIEFYSRFF